MEFKTNYCNIPPSIEQKIGMNLHNKKNHPLEIIKNIIYQYFDKIIPGIKKYDNLSPFVTPEQNFDSLRINKDHPARRKSDTYYINEKLLLRTQTTCHQTKHLKEGVHKFLVTGDVYRKDTVDSTHYPVFHQMEGAYITEPGVDPLEDLKKVLSGIVKTLFPGCEYRYNPDFFPFTEPSLEIEVKYKGEWLEILGCGVIHKEILKNTGVSTEENPRTGWAFGLGVERLAMILFDIPDIRYFWTNSEKFLSQFESGKIVQFKPYSKLEVSSKDIAFWIPKEQLELEDKTFSWNNENDFMELIREVIGDGVEKVELIDSFHNPKKDKYSQCWRITYSPPPNTKNPGEFFIKTKEYHRTICDLIGPKFNIECRS